MKNEFTVWLVDGKNGTEMHRTRDQAREARRERIESGDTDAVTYRAQATLTQVTAVR